MMRNYRELSDEEVEQLERLYPVTPNRRLSQMFSVSVDAIVDHFARPRGWKKNHKIVLIGSRGGRTLTEKEIHWIKLHYKHTKNKDIMYKFDIGESQLHRIARKYGLMKSRQFIKKTAKNNNIISEAVCKKYGIYELNAESTYRQWTERKRTGDYGNVGFKRGESNKDRMSPRRYRQMIEKARQTRNETIRRDRIRIHWGMEPKTKLVKNWGGKRDRHKYHYRYKFRQFGYDVESGSNDIYYFPDTVRHPIMECNAQKWGIKILPAEEEYETGWTDSRF